MTQDGVNPLQRAISLRVETIFAERDDNVRAACEYELELRFGNMRRVASGGTVFDAFVPKYLALGLFDVLCNKAAVDLCGEERCDVEREAVRGRDNKTKQRVKHAAGHVGCALTQKRVLLAPKDLPTTKRIEADVRVALERETHCGTLPECRGVRQRGNVVRRQRRSLRFIDSARGPNDFWRLDVTRLDDGKYYQLELELEFERALRVLRAERAALANDDDCDAFQAFAKDEIVHRGMALVALLEHYMLRTAEEYDRRTAFFAR